MSVNISTRVSENNLDSSAEKLDEYLVKIANGDREALKREMYRSLELYTGKSPKWGVLTGIRPVKLAGEILDSCGSMIELERILKEKGMEKVKQSMEFLVILCLCEYLPSDSVLICFIWIIPSKS